MNTLDKKIVISDPFWKNKIDQICTSVIPYQYQVLNDEIEGIQQSHAIENLRIAAGLSHSEYSGMLFQDSDVGKWIQAAANSLNIVNNSEIEKDIDSIVEIIEKAQQPDGYLNSYYTCAKPGERFSNIAHGHELYCAGHLIEGAIAYYNATAKDKFLKIMCRYVDYLMTTIGPAEGQLHIYSGHPEIELSLYKLYKITGNDNYLEFMKYLLEARGVPPVFLEKDPYFGEIYKDKWFGLEYHVAHKPIREQTEAVGHAVRAVYLYSAEADYAKETGDVSLNSTLQQLWDDVVHRKMYIIGGIGSEAHGESFSKPYDLPNDRAYTETCASIGLILWARRMLELEQKGEYADIIERALYNNVLGGISEDGHHYFYVNPLQMIPSAVNSRYDLKHVSDERVAWLGCACCPPNIARLLTALDEYIYYYDQKNKALFILLYIQNTVSINDEQIQFALSSVSEYLDTGTVRYSYSGTTTEMTIAFRIPQWCEDYSIDVNGQKVDAQPVSGFVRIHRLWSENDSVNVSFVVTPKFIFANPAVLDDLHKTAIMRGPLVYCFEEADNGPDVDKMIVDLDHGIELTKTEQGLALQCAAHYFDKDFWNGKLYSDTKAVKYETTITAVPYQRWGNRGKGKMLVWMNYSE